MRLRLRFSRPRDNISQNEYIIVHAQIVALNIFVINFCNALNIFVISFYIRYTILYSIYIYLYNLTTVFFVSFFQDWGAEPGVFGSLEPEPLGFFFISGSNMSHRRSTDLDQDLRRKHYLLTVNYRKQIANRLRLMDFQSPWRLKENQGKWL